MTALRREPLLWLTVAVILGSTATIYWIERPEHLTALSVLLIVETTVTVVGVLYALFVNFIWHLPLFRGWFVRVPDLRGTWNGVLTPLDPDGNPLPSIRCSVMIRQKLFSVNCVLRTEKAESLSFSGSAFLDEETNEGRLVYVYRGWPRLADRKTNPSHDGATLLVLGNDGRLTGTYFTDRCTRGTLELSRSGDYEKVVLQPAGIRTHPGREARD